MLAKIKTIISTLFSVRAMLGFIVIGLFVNAVVVTVSSNSFIPRTSIAGIEVGRKTPAEASALLNQRLEQQSVVLTLGEDVFNVSPGELGFYYDEADVELAMLTQQNRFIPVLWLSHSEQTTPVTSVAISELHTKLEQIAETFTVEADGGSLDINPETGEVVVKENTRGVSVDIEESVKMLLAKNIESGDTIPLVYDRLESVDQIENLEEAKKKIEIALEKPLILTYEGVELARLTTSEQIKLLDIGYENNQATVGVSDTAVSLLLEGVSKAVSVSPTVTSISLVDGLQSSIVEGSDGVALDSQTTNAIIAQVLFESGNKEAQIAVQTLVSPIEYTSSYSNTSAGLQARIEAWTADQVGRFGVKVVELNGDQHIAGVDQDASFVSASVYKLFVAYKVFNDIESGAYTLNTTLPSGNTVGSALQQAIVNSDNPTAIELAERAGGWGEVDAFISSQGFSATTLDNYKDDGSFNGDKQTTARDQAEYLRRLYSGSLVSVSHAKLLLSHMRSQVYRTGIPAGSTGTVADKVGFLYGYLHDSAIVETANSDYVLVILSDGSSWGKLAELTKLVEAHLAR